MNVSIIGTGYVGLVTAACFADRGHRVHCLDSDAPRVNSLQSGVVPFHEPQLPELVAAGVAAGRLSFTTNPRQALEDADVCFVTVGTPMGVRGDADMSQVNAAIDAASQWIDPQCVVVMKSTVPVGTNAMVRRRLIGRLAARGLDASGLQVVSTPEFLQEGKAVFNCLHPQRIVVGTSSERARAVMAELYRDFVPANRLLFMSPQSAELAKYASNAMLAARISFINEVAALCDRTGADVQDIKTAMAMDDRIGPHFLNAGCGYGGSCFPKDVRALWRIGEKYDLPMTIMKAVDDVNGRQKHLLPDMLTARLGADLKGLTIAVLGLAFKPDTDDLREAPSIPVIDEMLRAGAIVKAYDPIVGPDKASLLPDGLVFAPSAAQALEGADAAVLVTEWKELVDLDWERATSAMATPLVFDGRNVLSPERMASWGYEYYGIGRGVMPTAAPAC